MMPSFHSGFACDIQNMMEWRGTLGYAAYCYTWELTDFDRYCCKVFPGTDILTWDIVLSWLNAIRDRRDVRIPVAAIRNLGKYQIMLGKNACLFPANYFSYQKRRMPYMMSDHECQRFFDAADNYPHDKHNPLLTYTVATFFRLQFSTGMRPQEVRHLTRHDFDFIHDTIYIADSKRHKDRCIAVRHSVMEMCKRYDAIARSLYPDTNVFFPSRNRKEHSAESILLFFRKCWKRAGNPNPDDSEYCTPYILRHNFATRRITEWMEEGKDFGQYMPYLSTYMGHQTFSETCYYLHLMPERLSRMGYMDISDIVSEVDHEK